MNSRKIKKLLRTVTSSIAFLPSIISAGFFFLAVLVLSIEYTNTISEFKHWCSFLLVKDASGARSVLGILAGGIISLMVFSFSMVMIVLNRASSVLSPRVIPGLITKKSHQTVLGAYLGTIIFCLIIIINIRRDDDVFQVPSFGILISMLFGFLCLALFVYFIHSISQNIQVDTVLNELYKSTKKEIDDQVDFHENYKLKEPLDTKDWYQIESNSSGYFKGVLKEKLNTILEKNGLKLLIKVDYGFFTVTGFPFLLINKDLGNQKDLKEEILSCFQFYIEEFITDHHNFGLSQISEIAVKAMSPGINDPGTAIKAIDMLSILIMKVVRLPKTNYYCPKNLANQNDEKKKVLEPLLYWSEPELSKILDLSFSSIRTYSKSDPNVMINLLEALKNILFDCEKSCTPNNDVIEYVKTCITEADTNINNAYDRNKINKMIERIFEVNDSNRLHFNTIEVS